MAPAQQLDEDKADFIRENWRKLPCFKCDNTVHAAVNHKGGLSGKFWRALSVDEQKLAEALLRNLFTNHLREQKEAKKAAKNASKAGTESPGETSKMPEQQTAQLTTDPIIPPTGLAQATSTDDDPYASIAAADLKNIHDQADAEPVPTELPEPLGAPARGEVGPGDAHSAAPIAVGTANSKYPLRKTFATTTSEVLTNHYEISWKKDTEFYVYEILGIPTTKSKRQMKSVINTACQTCAFLKDNEDFFTTDHLKTIVSWKPLHLSIQDPRKNVPGQPDEVVWTPEPLADGDRRMDLTFKYHGKLNLERLMAFINPASSATDTTLANFNFDPLITHLNNVISKSMSKEVFQTSSHRFYFTRGHEPLGNSKSLCTMRGYDYTVKSAMGKVLLNINAATSAFLRPITVAEFMRDTNTFAKNELEKRIKGVKVFILPDRKSVKDAEEQLRVDNLNKPQNRIKTVNSFGSRIGDRTEDDFKFRKWFKNANGELEQERNSTHVIEHMNNVFGKEYGFSHDLEAVNVGSDEDQVWYPQEFLRILPYQMYTNLLPDRLVDDMLKNACKEPADIRARIETEGLGGLGVNRKAGPQAFDKCKVLEIKPNMLQIPSKRMPPVHIIYRGTSREAKMDDKAQWNLKGKVSFLESPASKETLGYYMIEGPDLKDPNTIDMYQKCISKQSSQYEVLSNATCLATATLPPYTKDDPNSASGKAKGSKKPQIPKTHEELKADILTAIQACRAQKAGGKLVILVLKSRQIPVYSAFKYVADCEAALHSLCLTEEKNLGKSPEDNNLALYIANVMMKVNLKLGGRNHTSADGANLKGRLSETLMKNAPGRSTMILGADVTHPGSGSITGCPSIATLVGSTDYDGGRFLGSMRVQSMGKQEVIGKYDMKSMAMERFRAWRDSGKIECNVLYYRDGVSTGQYDDVLASEVQGIKEAWDEVFKYPGSTIAARVTAIVAVKRHHTRFFPLAKDAHQNGNCKAGTLVDRGIVSPFFSEFFLQSHHALQGTAIPTRYFVLENGLKMSDTEIQNFTHKLCFTYVRATMGVSYAPPAYYADRLCERGRQYLRDWFTPNYDSDHYKSYHARKKEIEADEKKALQAKIQEEFGAQQPPAGRRRARKSDRHIQLERESRRKAEKIVHDEFLQKAKDYLNIKEGTERSGPWDKSLDGTMFWM